MNKTRRWMRAAAIVAVMLAVSVGHAALWSWSLAPTVLKAEAPRLQSVSYSPSGRDYDPAAPSVPAGRIAADMAAIAAFADGVRTYSSLGAPGQVPEIAARLGLKVSLGIWIGPDPQRNEMEIQRGIELARQVRAVTRVVVGNEALLRREISDANLARAISRVRAALPHRIKVGTADVWSEMVGAKETAKVSDFLGVHVLPYWEGVPAEKALAWIGERLEAVRQAQPGKPLFVGEIGWPSAGGNFHAAFPSLEAQAAVVRGFAAEAARRGVHYNIVEAFDGVWKSTIEGAPGPNWGILDADRTPKWPLTGAVPAPAADRTGALVAVVVGLLFSLAVGTGRRSNPTFALAVSVAANVMGAAAGLAVSGALGEYLTVASVTTWGSAFFLGALMLGVTFADIADVLRRVLTGRSSALLPRVRPDNGRQPFVSVHVAACRERPEVLGETLRSLARMDYPAYEVVVLINNTEDEALVLPVEALCAELGPRFKFHWYKTMSGFKAGALNAALRHTAPEAEVIAVLDADYTVAPDWLAKLAPVFADPGVGIVQAPQEHRDGHESRLKTAMTAEYRPFFDIGMQEGLLSQAFVCHGTMIMLRREAMERVGGWSEQGICEDTELGLRILAAGWRAAYTDERLGFGLAPDNFMQFRKQRDRWVFGSTQILRAHWRKFLPGNRSLTLAQKLGYLGNWLRWWSDAAGLVAALAAITWTFAALVLPLHLPPVEATAAVLGALVWRTGSSLVASRLAAGNSWRESVGASAAGMALSTTVALAALRGLFRRSDIFRVTAKGGKAAARRFCALPEAVLAAALVMSALTAALCNPMGTVSLALWSVLLTAMAVPNLMAVGFAVCDMMPARPESEAMPARPASEAMPARPASEAMPARPASEAMVDGVVQLAAG